MDILTVFSPLTLTFIGVLALLTLYFHGPAFSRKSVHSAPALLTSLGIFGTFLGVALGLLEFDSRAIEQSVPTLIEGLKTAFWSSIAGLLGALSIKFRYVMRQARRTTNEPVYQGATLDDLASLLGELRDLLREAQLQQLPGQLAASQQTLASGLQTLQQSLNDWQQSLADKNAQALTQALEGLVQAFNQGMTTQFGDNFKQLNESVQAMLAWQQAYQGQLEQLFAQQRANAELLDQATDAYTTMVRHTQAFTGVSEALGEMLAAMQGQTDALGQYLQELAGLVGKATDGLPALEGRVLALTEQLGSSIEQSHRQMNQLLQTTAQNIEQTVARVNHDLVGQVKELQASGHEQLLRMLDRNEQQLLRLDNALEQELTHALRTFGFQLTALSEKFVNDYLPLTDKLRAVVQLAADLEKEKAGQ